MLDAQDEVIAVFAQIQVGVSPQACRSELPRSACPGVGSGRFAGVMDHRHRGIKALLPIRFISEKSRFGYELL